MVLQILILFMILFVLPTLVGGIFAAAAERGNRLLFRWVSGQFCLWAGFLLICVPVILIRQGDGFTDVIKMNAVFAAAMLLFSAGVEVKRRVTAGRRIPVEGSGRRVDLPAAALWVLVLGLLILQLIMAVTLAYEEGDDAFYVATASITAESETMYKILPYTGGATGFDARHGLAPFPIWVAMLGWLSGMHPAAVAHVVLPVVLILMAYAVFYMLGKHLFREGGRKLPLFLLFLELLILCGGQSLYTAENFLLVRTAQGKAVLAQIVIPFLILLLAVLLEKLQQGGRVKPAYWLLLGLTALSGSLCSTQGVLLTVMLLGGVSACAALCYHRWKVLLPTAACCVVPTVLAFLYFFVN
ncbi:MAG: DUF6077 domain-containing protein [bacterium]|nr:DUF6077 domain-containing protein [bacterium]